MNHPPQSPTITLRIPGDWDNPGELLARLPVGVRLTPEALILPDDTPIEFIPMQPDGEFPQVFKSSCRRPPTRDEQGVISRYTVNVALSAVGGSLEGALRMMRAGAAIVQAGGAGVFIDNSALSHGGNDWLEMTDDGGTDAISFAFTSIIGNRQEYFTVGMHTMGFADLSMPIGDANEQGKTLVELISYVCQSSRPVEVGDVMIMEAGRQFQIVGRASDDFPAGSPMHNPWGRLNIKSLQGIAQSN